MNQIAKTLGYKATKRQFLRRDLGQMFATLKGLFFRRIGKKFGMRSTCTKSSTLEMGRLHVESSDARLHRSSAISIHQMA